MGIFKTESWESRFLKIHFLNTKVLWIKLPKADFQKRKNNPEVHCTVFQRNAEEAMMDKDKSDEYDAVVTDKIMLYEDTMERYKYKDPNMKSSMDNYTYNVPGSVSHLRSFPRHETVKFDKPHSRSATKDQMLKGRLKGSQMEVPNMFHMQNQYDAPTKLMGEMLTPHMRRLRKSTMPPSPTSA
jgi:hypothetical protein